MELSKLRGRMEVKRIGHLEGRHNGGARQNVGFRLSGLAIVALSAGIAGCATEALRWYQPSGTGVAEVRHCGGPKEVMTFRLNEAGSTLKVSVEPAYRDKQLRRAKPNLSYAITLGPDSAIRILDPVVSVVRRHRGSPIPLQDVEWSGFQVYAGNGRGSPCAARSERLEPS